MKKTIALLLLLVLLFEAIPTEALADGLTDLLVPHVTEQQLTAALLRTGTEDDAPIYHEGMALSESMSAAQVVGWLDNYLSGDLAYILDTFANYDVAMHEALNSKDPEIHIRAQTLLNRFYDEFSVFYTPYQEAKLIYSEVSYYRQRIAERADRIALLSEELQSAELTRREAAISSFRMKQAWEQLEDDIRAVIASADGWKESTDKMTIALTGTNLLTGTNEDTDEYSLWGYIRVIEDLLERSGSAAVARLNVPASALRVEPDPHLMTRLARLTPISSALADAGQTMNVTVVDDKSVAIVVKDEAGFVRDAAVTISMDSQDCLSVPSDEMGCAYFFVRNFQSDDDGEMQVNLRVEKDGYRKIDAPSIWMRKGQGLTTVLAKDNGEPYPLSLTFRGHDTLLWDYETVQNPYNDSDISIGAKVWSADGCEVYIYARDKAGSRVLEIGRKTVPAGKQQVSFRDRWLQKLPADCTLCADLIADDRTYTYPARLVVKPSQVEMPLGDPNMKLLQVPGVGFSFTLPSNWPSPPGCAEHPAGPAFLYRISIQSGDGSERQRDGDDRHQRL